MADSTNPNASNNTASNFLPRIYRTDANKKFLQATLEQLIQPGTVQKINGYIGRRNAKAATGDDIFIAAVEAARQNYQLEPGLIVQDTLNNTTFFKDYIDYINQTEVFGGDVSNHARLNKQEFYSWDPHIDWDKFVNFQNYYWLPYGPDTITIYGQRDKIESTYTVVVETEGDSNQYLLTPNGLTRNPTLTLYKGHTYKFEITSLGNPFSIKTHRSSGSNDRYSNYGLDGVAVEQGTITFTVPHDAPSVLYYQSENDTDLGGVIHVLSINDNSHIDVTVEILGKKTYKLADGTQLSNGMKVEFGGNVVPVEYATGKYYVEGVGTAIKLINTDVLELVGAYTTSESILFDSTPFDKSPFSDATAFAGTPDYLLINRASRDHNPWSRYNRWFHKDTIEVSATLNGNVPTLDQSARATRAIIEFEADLKLYNFGNTAIADVDLIDTFTTDVFSTIEGSIGYNVDGIDLIQGQRILFTADTDIFVKNKIYQVEFIDVTHTSINGQISPRQIHLTEVSDPVMNQCVLIHQGVKNQGEMFWYTGSTWQLSQQKTALNQSPLFDVVDSSGISFGNTDYYYGSTFNGTKIFSYKIGNGSNDSALGFPLTYKNINNVGDIVFNFNLITDIFRYKDLTTVIDKVIDVGYLIKYDYAGNTTYVNGWQTNTLLQSQAAIRIYKSSGKTNNFDIDIFDNVYDLDDLIVKVYINGIRLASTKWDVVDGPIYKKVVLLTDISSSDILTIRAFSAQTINSNGFYEIPINLQNNPLNNSMGDFTLGEVLDHVTTIVDNIETLVGEFPGSSNLRDLGNVTQYGTRFVQHSGPASLSIYHMTSDTNNVIRAVEKSRDDYNNFKRRFTSVSSTLGIDTDVATHVNLVLQEMNKDKPNNAPYYFSDMVPCGANIKTVLTVVDYRIKTYPLTSVFNLDELSNQAVIVYVNDTQLMYGRDYTFSSQGFIVVSATLQNDDTITIFEYENTDGCFVPETPTKLGIWPKYEPKIYIDTSLITPRTMIQGHDGSQVLAYGDYRDDLILELEKRIYNNIKVKYDDSIFDIHSLIPSYNRSTDYSLAEFNTVLAPSFYKWTTLIEQDFTKPMSYDSANSFTFNYRGHSAPDGRETPGYWRGVYRWILDTDRPNICPWEMLGLSEAPLWWESVYGPAPYTSNNLILWKDISEGVLKEPGKPVVYLPKFAKPFLMQHIPVDENGNIKSPLMTDLANGIITVSTTGDFVFGDVSPIENAWRRSSHYPFSVLLTSLLLTPANTFGLLLDRSRIVRNVTGQLIYKDTGLRVTPSSIKLPNSHVSTVRIQTAGIINYITNYIMSDNLTTYSSYQTDLSMLTIRLSHRLGSFTSKEKFNLILDSKTPLSSGSVFVPPENYDIILNSSSPVKKITYSGVIITKLADGFEVKGYSRTHPYFNYYSWEQSGININVGGISESYINWTGNQYYPSGKIVNYNNRYYRVKTSHTSTTEFNEQYHTVLSSLPVIGGKEAIFRKRWDRTSAITVPYNTKFTTIQDVVDFLLGYGEYLKDQGFAFDDFNTTMSQVTNWETSAKEFLFWTTQNWSSGEDKWNEWLPNTLVVFETIVRYNGDYYKAIRNSMTTDIFNDDDFVKLDGLSSVGSSVISLSPAASKLTFSAPYSVVDDVTNQFNGYEIYRVDGQPIEYDFLNSYREDNKVSYASEGNDGIYGASFYLVQKEQIVIIDNTTLFNDTIYHPESGYKQDRIKVAGYVSTNWYGAFDVPGFIFDQAHISRWSSWVGYDLGDIVQYKEFYYSASKVLLGAESFVSTDWIRLSKKPTAQLLPNWNYKAGQFEDFYSLDSDNFDVNQQKMAQHLIGYQKRQYLENIIQDDVSEFKFYQGMIIEKGTQNVFNKLFDVLSAENEESLTFYEEWALRVGQYGANAAYENIEFILDESEFKNNPQGFELVSSIDRSKVDFISRQTSNDVYLKPIGYDSNPWPLLKNDVSYLRSAGYVRSDEVLMSLKSMSDILTQDISQFSTGDYVWCTFDAAGWNVYRYTDANIVVTDITYDNINLTITTDSSIFLEVGSYIGITQVTGFSGFYEIISVSMNTMVVAASGITVPSPFIEQDVVIIHTFTSQRAATMDIIDSVLPNRLKENEMVWTDDNGSGQWASWVYSPVYINSTVINPVPVSSLNFGKYVQLNNTGNLLAVSTSLGQVVIYDKAGTINPWIKRQTIDAPIIKLADSYNLPNNLATSIALSLDNRWLATGSPITGRASYSNNGQLNVVDIAEVASTIVNHGVISIYEKDVNNVYTLVNTILSPVPVQDELFGSSLAFGNDALYVGSTGGNGKIYKLLYSPTVYASANYNPVGSTGTTVHLSSITDIIAGMTISGIGFTLGQVVTYVNSVAKTILVSDEPDSIPSGVLTFSTTEWKYDLTSTKTGVTTNSGYGSKLDISQDGNVLVSAAPGSVSLVGKVFVYKADSLVQTITGGNSFFGKSITISDTGSYIAISDILADGIRNNQGNVSVYINNGTQYEIFQSLVIKNPEVSQYFGSNISFTNDYKTLVVYSPLADTENYWVVDDETTFDESTTKFLLQENIDSGRIDVYNQYASKWVFSESLSTSNTANDGYGYSMAVGSNSIIISAPYATNVSSQSGLVYEYHKTSNTYSWMIKHVGIIKPDTSKIKQAFLYNRVSNKLITYLDVLDPLHGKIPGIADEEIRYKVFYDPAIYSIGGSGTTVDDGSAWKKEKVGLLWWDLRTSKFVTSNDDDVVYRNNTWSTLATGASVDIYEWVESKYLPADWDLQADTEAGLALNISGTTLYGNTAYSIGRRYDNISQTFKNTYYFWVKNKKTTPAVVGRTISASSVSNLIGNARGDGYQYLALTGSNSFSLANVKSLLKDRDVVLSVEYWVVDKIDQNIHSQWKLISSEINTQLPYKIEKKWFDSLCGKDEKDRLVPDISLPIKLQYGIEFRPRQSMFINRFEALKQYVEQANLVLQENLISESRDLSNLESYEAEPNVIRGLYDSVLDTDAELRFAAVSTYTRPSLTPIITDGRITGVEITSSGSGYLNPPYIEVVGSGVDAVVKATINSSGKITGATIINSGEGYTDYTVMIVRDYSVLVHSDSESSGKWSIYSYDPTTYVWSRTHSQTYDTTNYWSFVDWYATGYNKFSSVVNSVDTYSELFNIEVNIGELVKVRTTNVGNWVILEKYADSQSVDWTSSYKIVGSQNGTIQLSPSLYQFVDTGVGYDNVLYDGGNFDNNASVELRNILNAMKNDIFIDELKSSYLNLFFTTVRYALSEQTYVDWIFKTSFIKARHTVGALSQPVTYKNDNLSNFEDYVAEVKPYRTKIREYISAYNRLEVGEMSITDFDLPAIYENGQLGIIDTRVTDDVISVDNSIIQTYPWKHWLDNVGFTITELNLVNSGSGYVSEPVVRIVSNSGSGAVARAFIANGRVNRITLLSTGSGYLSAPSVYIEGGLETSGTAASAIAVIGDSVVRSTLVKMKFDRITQTYFITKLQETETLIGTGSRLQFPLTWAPDVRIGTVTVTINGIGALRDNYKLKIVKSTAKGYTSYSGSITFDFAPATGDVVVVTYLKDWSLLNAADRIQFYYNPQTGDLGKDLSQLMTGIDYGGVIVSGIGFDISRGWDSTPFFSDKWDTSDPTFDDYIVVVAEGTHTFTLPYIPSVGTLINVYHNEVRIDDEQYGTPQQTNDNAVMLSWEADGVSQTIVIPNTVVVLETDQFIFRKTTSDGSIKPQESDYDTALSGGDLAYSTATGLSASDLIIDGDGFVTPTSSSAPEEVVPGQVVDAVAIKVYDRPSSGSAGINVDNYVADGEQTVFSLTKPINSPRAIIVKVSNGVDSEIKTIDIDYEVDYQHNLVIFEQAPENKAVVSIFGIGINGNNILDVGYVVGDGQATEFVTKAPWVTPVTSNVCINGVVFPYELFQIDDFIGVRFATAPEINDIINYIIVSGLDQTFAVTKIEKIAVDGRSSELPYDLLYSAGDSLPIESNIIVRVDNLILSSPNNSYFTIKSNRLTYVIDSTKFLPYSVDVYNISVFAGGNLLSIGSDYSVDFSVISIKLSRVAYATYSGQTLVVSVNRDNGYFYIPQNGIAKAKILFTETYNSPQQVEVISSYKHEVLDIQRTTVRAMTDSEIITDTPAYYYYKDIMGGILQLERAVINDDYVWIVKNGNLLIPSVDYKLNANKTSVTLSVDSVETDEYTIITYGSNIVLPNVAYMQFKDMLNRTHFKRLSANKQTKLAADLHWNDIKISVEDASNFDIPNPAANRPGIIEIRGERIEYFSLVNTGGVWELGQIRRGTLGTGTPSIHLVGAYVQDIGSSETIPYSETSVIEQVIAEGTHNVSLTFVPTLSTEDWSSQYASGFISAIPSGYGQANDIEVFVGGYSNEVEWAANVSYVVDAIVIVGSYTYRCTISHTSSSDFSLDSANWMFFIGNIRLKKHPYRVHNVNINPDSPDGDIQFDADFSVDGIDNNIYLTNVLSTGTIVTVVKRTGNKWNNEGDIQRGTGKIEKFLKATPGIWYTQMNQ